MTKAMASALAGIVFTLSIAGAVFWNALPLLRAISQDMVMR